MTKKDFYDSIKNNLAELRKFFAEMPKGGDSNNPFDRLCLLSSHDR